MVTQMCSPLGHCGDLPRQPGRSRSFCPPPKHTHHALQSCGYLAADSRQAHCFHAASCMPCVGLSMAVAWLRLQPLEGRGRAICSSSYFIPPEPDTIMCLIKI